MGLIVLIAGLVIFLCSHLFVTRRDARAAMIARLGTNGYRAAFSVVSIVGLVLIVWGFGHYRADGYIDVWSPPAFMRHIAVLLMLFASIFLTAVFIPSHIKARLKYPMLTSVKTWALAHLLVNGDLGSILLFGSMLAWAVFARIAAKNRTSEAPVDVLPKTTISLWSSDLYAAIGTFNQDFLVVVIGIVVYLALGFVFHPILIGVPAFGV